MRTSSIHARSILRPLAAALGAAVTIAVSTAAHGAACPTTGKLVYVNGGGKALIENLAKVLAPTGVTILYKQQGSCAALDSIVIGTPLTGDVTMWTSTDPVVCQLDAAGVVADIGISDVFPTTCAGLPGGLPDTVKDFRGPIEAYAFVVPKASSQKSISMEAAYSIFGFGKDSGVEPWTDETAMLIRDPASGTQQMLAAAIGVPVDQWKGTGMMNSTDLITQLKMAVDPEKAIGILTSELAGDQELSLTTLAYQAQEQLCGYWPDSTPTSNDKRNVRDGHYWIWGPLHFLSQVDANNSPLNPDAKDIINILIGTKDPPMGLDLISILAKTHIVPDCAMQVTRDTELGPLSSYMPDKACGCYFELSATGQTDCQKCVSNVDCPEERSHCNYGYCEFL